MYLSKSYLSISRLYAYIEQYKYINDNDNVLEIGNGAGVFQCVAKKIANYKVIDFDGETRPDFVADITKWDDIKQHKNNYDVIFCCQVLEHIPFSEVECAINNIFSLNAKKVIISVPDNRKAIRLKFVFRHHSYEKVISLPFSGIERNISNNKDHFWEIWYKNYRDVSGLFNSNKDYRLVTEYRLFERHYQHFFILERT